jgi:hypothetical protein
MRKVYGVSKIDLCPFCNKQSVTRNKQGVPVCNAHKESLVPDIKCVCGEYLELLSGKYGVFFKCINCGNISMKKALELAGDGFVFSIGKNTEKKENNVSTPASFNAHISGVQEKYSLKNVLPAIRNEKEKIILPDDPDYFD